MDSYGYTFKVLLPELAMKIVIPDDYQDMVDQLPCYSLIKHHDVKRYREPARKNRPGFLSTAKRLPQQAHASMRWPFCLRSSLPWLNAYEHTGAQSNDDLLRL